MPNNDDMDEGFEFVHPEHSCHKRTSSLTPNLSSVTNIRFSFRKLFDKYMLYKKSYFVQQK
jgi:hypothetical protein